LDAEVWSSFLITVERGVLNLAVPPQVLEALRSSAGGRASRRGGAGSCGASVVTATSATSDGDDSIQSESSQAGVPAGVLAIVVAAPAPVAIAPTPEVDVDAEEDLPPSSPLSVGGPWSQFSVALWSQASTASQGRPLEPLME
jgi:hypothetical protein